MTFDDFAGNPRAVATLRKMLDEDRLPPSLLFAGEKGTGKFTLARLVAQAANCERGKSSACGKCPACKALESLADLPALTEAAVKERGSANPEDSPLILRPHTNVSVLVPDGSFIRVSQMRYVVRHAYTRPTGGGRLFFLIDEAERLRGEMADVLLKVLEEPPEATTLILVTHAPFKLRPTILSRCITLHFGPLSTEAVLERLQKLRPGWSKGDRHLAASVARGSLGSALELDLERYRAIRSQALEVLRTSALRRFNPDRLFEATAGLAGKSGPGELEKSTGGERNRFDFGLEVLYSLVNDVLYLKTGKAEQHLRNPDLIGELRELASGTEGTWMATTVEGLDRLDSWRRRNVNRQLSLDTLALRTDKMQKSV